MSFVDVLAHPCILRRRAARNRPAEIEVPYGVDRQDLDNKSANPTQILQAEIQPEVETTDSGVPEWRESELEKQVFHLQTEQAKLNHLKNIFLNTASNNLRSHFFNIQMAIQMLELSIRREEIHWEEQSECQSKPTGETCYLQIIKNACEKEISLLNDLLTLQQLEAEAQPLLPGTLLSNKTHLQNCLKGSVHTFERQPNCGQASFKIDIAAHLSPLINNLALLDWLLSKLLDNACELPKPKRQIAADLDRLLHEPG
jgi:signal transduction histidine kinase